MFAPRTPIDNATPPTRSAPPSFPSNPLLQPSGTPPAVPRPPGTLPGNVPTSMPPLDGDTHTDSAVRQVGRYRIQARLGRGGMATVYKAHDPSIGRDVAIKFLHASLCEDEEYRARFLREARAAGGLSHPNIVTVHDVGEIEGRPYMAMELIDGEPLSDVLDDGKPLPMRDVVVIGIQLARALDYAHARGIVHRDIKPGNIMLRATARRRSRSPTSASRTWTRPAAEQRTRVGDVLGTPQYMSPEQTQGEKLDGRSDLFSAGIVLYQMLAGAAAVPGRQPGRAGDEDRQRRAAADREAAPRPAAGAAPHRRALPGQGARPRASRPARELADALDRVLAEHRRGGARSKDSRASCRCA